MSTYETLSVIVAALALPVSTVVLILLIQQIRLLARQVDDARQAINSSTLETEQENKRKRERATIQFIAATMAKLDETYDQVPASGSDAIAAFIDKAAVRESAEFRALRNYLNYIEDLSVGINLGVFDPEILNRTIGPRMLRAWDAYEAWILKERNDLGFPSLFSDLENCSKVIRELRATPKK